MSGEREPATFPEHVLFDLDDTLYPAASGFFRLVSARITGYIQESLGLEPHHARVLQRRYWRRYGTSLRGLMVRHGVDPEPFLAYVHDVPVERVLAADARLRRALESLPARRHVFTNAPAAYVRRVLVALDVEDLFEKIFDIASFDYIPKPNPAPYDHVARVLGARAGQCALVDDAPANLVPARERGWLTVWLRAPESWLGGAPGLSAASGAGASADAVVERLDELGRALTAVAAARAAGGQALA